MSYERKKWTFPRSIEIEENHSGRYGAPGEKRKERKNKEKKMVRTNHPHVLPQLPLPYPHLY